MFDGHYIGEPVEVEPAYARMDERAICVRQLEQLKKDRARDEQYPSGSCCLSVLDEAIALLKASS